MYCPIWIEDTSKKSQFIEGKGRISLNQTFILKRSIKATQHQTPESKHQLLDEDISIPFYSLAALRGKLLLLWTRLLCLCSSSEQRAAVALLPAQVLGRFAAICSSLSGPSWTSSPFCSLCHQHLFPERVQEDPFYAPSWFRSASGCFMF